MSAPGRTLSVRVPGGRDYDVRVEPGGLPRLAGHCVRAAPAHRYALILDSQVARLYRTTALDSFRQLDVRADAFDFPAGEWNKTRETWAALSDRLAREGFGRDSAVVALGGGVTGDVAGFVAATYMRGIPVIQVPTTVLAMLDSSVGGKTGLDTEIGKNLIGAFHHPALVLIDPAVLETLPRQQRAAGLAEAVKTAAILDSPLWDWIEAHAPSLVDGDIEALTTLVGRVVACKIDVVSADPLESDLRAVLNFGHTVGHALEALEGYTLLHGEAVAAGMRVESRLGEALGVTETGTAERVEALLAACELDRAWETERRREEVVDAMRGDKKIRGGCIRCVFLRRIGEVAADAEGRHTHELDDEALADPLAAALRPDRSR